jgi:uncharacterized protein (DUF433 family)
VSGGGLQTNVIQVCRSLVVHFGREGLNHHHELGTMSATVSDIGRLISQDASLHRGRAIIAGTGVSVKRIVGWYQLGLSPEQIVAEIPHLGLAQVHAALAYYHANRDEVEADLAAEEETAQRLMTADASAGTGA